MPPRARQRLLALAAVALAALLAADAGAEASVYAAKQRRAEELLPLARAALGEGGSAVVDARTNSIVLLGEPAAVGRALELLAAQDRPTRTVVIRYEERRLSELDASGVRVRWSAGSEHVRVGNAVPLEAGTRILVTPEGVEHRSGGRLAGILRVLDGDAGRIATGEIVPFTSERATRYGVVVDTERLSAESGFEVRPRVLGDERVELSIVPFGARIRDDGSIATSGASTTVIVEAGGEPAVIGGIASGRRAQTSGRLSGGGVERGQDDRVLLVSVDLE